VVVRFQPTPVNLARPAKAAERPRPAPGARGFTLIEIMVVVVIIAVLAALAVPTITQQMRSRRTQFAAKEVASLYRNARMRAMGRGSAVLVRFDTAVDAKGALQVREAVRSASTDPNCDRLPVSSCTQTTWVPANNDSMLINQFDAKSYESVQTQVVLGGTTMPQMDVCFSPMGRTFVRYGQIGPFAPLTDVPVIEVARVDGNAWGLIRQVLLLPNGAVRLGTAKEAP
jgi:prepilin-type N-terminal cleavage/methylation domain-containing protein